MLENSFKKFVLVKEGKEHLEEPHIISSDPPMRIPNGLQKIVEAFKESKKVPLSKEVDPKGGGEKFVTMRGKKLYIVGGAVRDFLLKRTPRDYNLVTDAHPKEIEKICKFFNIDIVDVSSGKVTVRSRGETYEIETMKSGDNEGKPMFVIDPKDDVQRRDLTINALYYDTSSHKIIDHTGGIHDLKNGESRIIGNPDEKLKDHKTALRYARFSNLLPNGKKNNKLKDGVAKKMDSGDVDVKDAKEEFWKGVNHLHSNVPSFVKSWKEMKILPIIFPGLDVSGDAIDLPTGRSRAVLLASILRNNGPQKISSILPELGYTDRDVKDVVFLINLPKLTKENLDQFKNKLLRTGLTKRQVKDWATALKLEVPPELLD